MPKFYLHLCNGTGFTEDHEGSEHRDLDAVHAVAMATLREVLAGEIKEGGLNTASFIEIEDQHRDLVATVTFEEAVAVSNRVGEQPADAPPLSADGLNQARGAGKGRAVAAASGSGGR